MHQPKFESPLERLERALQIRRTTLEAIAPRDLRLDEGSEDPEPSWRSQQTGGFILSFENGRALRLVLKMNDTTSRPEVLINDSAGFMLRLFDQRAGHYVYSTAVVDLEDFEKCAARFQSLCEQISSLPNFRPYVHETMREADMPLGETFIPGVHGWVTSYELPQVGKRVCIDMTTLTLDLEDDGNKRGLPGASG